MACMSETELDGSRLVREVKVLVVDDHPALRAGLQGLLEQEPGFVCVAALTSQRELGAAIDRLRPDVVLLDYALDRGDGLTACFRTKQLPDPPGVVLYSAYVDRVFAVPATLAQADAMVSKIAPVEELLSVVRRVAAGEPSMPRLDRDAMEAASARLAAEDLPVAGMLFGGASVGEIARTLDASAGEVSSRALRMIGELQARDRSGERVRLGELERSLE